MLPSVERARLVCDSHINMSGKEQAVTARAEGTFTVASWSEDTYSELDGKG